MTDKDLIDLAAKAAGIGPLDFNYAERDGHGLYFGPRLPMPQGVVMAAMHSYWNPLTDDGDALRLAVKLDMSVDISEYETSTYAYAGWTPRVYATEMWKEDKDAATRRAIVRAAAEVGKTIQ